MDLLKPDLSEEGDENIWVLGGEEGTLGIKLYLKCLNLKMNSMINALCNKKKNISSRDSALADEKKSFSFGSNNRGSYADCK